MKVVWAGVVGIGLSALWLFMEFFGGIMTHTPDLAAPKSQTPGRRRLLRNEMRAARVCGAAGAVLLLVGVFA